MINESDVARVALLARLKLGEDETRQLAQQLQAILGHFEHVSKIDTAGVEPLVTPTDMPSYLRQDKCVPWENPDAAMKNAPERVGNLFKVPPVVG